LAGREILLWDLPLPPADTAYCFQGAAQEMPPPQFQGNDTLALDLNQAPAVFKAGVRDDRSFEFTAPNGPQPPTLKLRYKSPQNPYPLDIPLRFHHIRIEQRGPMFSVGELHGSI